MYTHGPPMYTLSMDLNIDKVYNGPSMYTLSMDLNIDKVYNSPSMYILSMVLIIMYTCMVFLIPYLWI